MKRWYTLTNRNGHEGQITKKQQRAKIIRDIKQREENLKKSPDEAHEEPQPKQRGHPRKNTYFGFKDGETEDLGQARFDVHHQIGESQRFREDLFALVSKNPDDPALQVSISFCTPRDVHLTTIELHTRPERSLPGVYIGCTIQRRGARFHGGTTIKCPNCHKPHLLAPSSLCQLHYIRRTPGSRLYQPSHARGHYGIEPWRRQGSGRLEASLLVCARVWDLPREHTVYRTGRAMGRT